MGRLVFTWVCLGILATAALLSVRDEEPRAARIEGFRPVARP